MDTIMVITAAFLPFASALIALLLAFYATFRSKKPANLPDGDTCWPIIGQTLAFLKPHKSTSMGTFLEEHCSKYGKVFKSHLFGSPAIVSCDYELSSFILQNEDKLFPVSYPKAMHGILGTYSVLMASGQLHRKLRSIVVNFSTMSKSNPSFLSCLGKYANSMMDSWKPYKEIEFHNQIKKFTLDVMLKTLLSMEPEEPLALEILKEFLTYMKGFVSLPLDIPGSAYSKAVKARVRLSSIVGKILKERVEETIFKGDFLDVILSKRSLNDEHIVSIVLDILLAGYETSSNLISLILYFLSHSPRAYQHMKEEHELIRKSKAEEGKSLDFEDYQKMEFTQNVIYEAMRLGNVVKFVHRKATQDVKYKEYVIPKGWKVIPVLASAHLDPTLHKNPLEFNPWRWTEKGAANRKIMPFGGGPRLCPGAELSKVETAFFLHHLVLRYRWKVKADDWPMAYPYVEFQRGLLLEIEELI